MIIIGEKAYLKSYDSKMHNEANNQNEISKSIKIQNEEISKNKVQRKESKSSNNDIYKNIKNKARILINDQRDIQEKVSLIQIQEQKVDEVENILKKVKSNYVQAIQNETEEEIKQKIKIKRILKKVDVLKGEQSNTYLNDNKKILSTLNEALNKINYIKTTLSQYKSKLLSLESIVNEKRKEVESKENNIQKSMKSDEFINEKIIVNPLDFISIKGDISSVITININI